MHEGLSDREHQVFLMLAEGESPTEIGKKLSLSVKTISTHRSRILEKMQMKKNSELIHYAISHRLLQNSELIHLRGIDPSPPASILNNKPTFLL